MTAALSRLRRLWRSEEGSAVIPFVMFVPVFIAMVVSTFELGVLMLRQVMLERGLDMAVREVRLGTWPEPTHDWLKARVCALSVFLPDCNASLVIEMVPVSKVTWDLPPGQIQCVDKSKDFKPLVDFLPGGGDQLMLLRACIKLNTFFPNFGIGTDLNTDANGDYGLTAVSAFVIEPS